MMRSLFSGVSGIKVHQTRMDVIGNNIANINTIGFKSSRTTFSDMLSQLQSSASAPTDGLGGINAKQIGLGVNVESIDLIFTDSSPQQTGKNTDLALSGNGLFVLRNGEQSYYTRNGAFSFDESGYYVLPGSGLRVQGWNATNGVLNTNGTPTDVIVPVGKTMEAQVTTTVDYTGNLNKESLTIKSIQPIQKTGGTLGDVTTYDNYSTTVSIADDDGNVIGTGTLTSSSFYAAGDTVSLTYGTVTDNGDGTYSAQILDDAGNVITTLTDLTTQPTEGDTVPNVTAAEDSTGGTGAAVTSVNVDGVNALAAVITLSDGTTMNVTNGYYEVGKSVPVTTLATVYDSLGGQHQVTLLLDKDSTSVDANLTDDEAIATGRVTNYTYTDDSGNTQTVAANAANLDTDNLTYEKTYTVTRTGAGTDADPYVYTYTDDSGNEQTVTAGTEGFDADNLTYTKTFDVERGDTIFDNRWRTYIAPGVGQKGPADPNFTNSYTRSAASDPPNSEADGSSTVGTMDSINYIYFSDTGQFISNGQDELGSITFTYGDGNGAADQNSSINFIGMTQYANATTCYPITDGNAAGILQSIAIDGNGIISGTYTNGLVQAEAQIAVAQFNNSAGLTKVGTTIYQESNNSGSANVKTIADFGLSVISSALEMSNVDLATEFSDMIVTQRGFQANSKVTTVSDEMLETLVNMKR